MEKYKTFLRKNIFLIIIIKAFVFRVDFLHRLWPIEEGLPRKEHSHPHIILLTVKHI